LVVWSPWAYINEPRDPKGVLYKAVELASSFSDLQKLTYFVVWLRLQGKSPPDGGETRKEEKNGVPRREGIFPEDLIWATRGWGWGWGSSNPTRKLDASPKIQRFMCRVLARSEKKGGGAFLIKLPPN
jgi:hypothetical protein